MWKINYKDFTNQARELYHQGMIEYGQLIEEEMISSMMPYETLNRVQEILDNAQTKFEQEMRWNDE